MGDRRSVVDGAVDRVGDNRTGGGGKRQMVSTDPGSGRSDREWSSTPHDQYGKHQENEAGVRKLTTRYAYSEWKPDTWNNIKFGHFLWKQANCQQ